MKIGILTFVDTINYGALLQAYALETVLTNMEHDVEIIQYKNKFIENREKNKNIFTPYWILRAIIIGKNFKRKTERFKKFEKDLINRSKMCSDKTIGEICASYDKIIVGSDQVWRRYGHIKDMAYYFLDFTLDWPIKRISYAASFGSDEWLYSADETIRCSNMLKKFSGVSVREFEGQLLCKKYLHAEAEVVIDPTLLLPKEHYSNSCHDCKSCSHNFLTYILDKDDNKHKSLSILERILGQKAYEINRVNMFGQKPSIESWLTCFKTAEFVFTDSFHGCVFSIIFNKPFIVYSNPIRGTSRFRTLLNLLGLQERMVYNPTEIDVVYNKSIDWNSVNKKIGLLRLQAKEFLIKSLS